MFIVKKMISGKDYYYLRKSERKDGKVRAVTVAYLGKTKKGAEKRKKEIENLKMEEIKKDVVKETVMEKPKISIEDLATFCKQKGFIFRSSDVYGGFAGFWDYGPLGVELFNNLKSEWWNHFVTQRENVVGIEASVISHPKTWKASGHLEGFKDVAVICEKCKNATKVDVSEFGKIDCEKCGGEFEKQGEFNLLFKTDVGALDVKTAYLRGETAQSMFMDFKLVQQTSRKQLPFGIAQIGRCFRNEIAPRDFLFRSREFHIGEFEFFIHPEEKACNLLTENCKNVKFDLLDEETQLGGKDDLKESSIGDLLNGKKLDEWHAYWLAEQVKWFRSLGLEAIKVREHTKDELSHYSSATFDIDYTYPFGSKEVAGIADRGQFDLTQHQNESKENLEIFDEKSGKKVLPRVIEPTFGMERVFLAVLTNSYFYDKTRDYIVLKLPPMLAPVKAAIFPIVKKPEFEKLARDIFDELKKEWNVNYDRSGSIGRRYARNDEIGTPYCITIDGDALEKKDVTIRDRDTAKQVRVKVKDLKETLRKLVRGEIKFSDLS